MNSRRRLLLNLRRSIVAHRTFDVHLSDDELYEIQTCRSCGHSIKVPIEEVYSGTKSALRRKLVAYRAQGGVSGKCPHCTKRLRDERYPL